MIKAHRKTVWGLLMIVALCLTLCTCVAEGSFGLQQIPEEMRPGKLVQLAYVLEDAGMVDIYLMDDGEALCAPVAEYHGDEGINYFTWDAYELGQPIAPGDYTLALFFNGEQVAFEKLAIGEESPVLSQVAVSDHTFHQGESLDVNYTANVGGVVRLTLLSGGEEMPLKAQSVSAGEGTITWDGQLNGEVIAPGTYTVSVSLSDFEGYEATQEQFSVTVEAATVVSVTVQTDDYRPPNYQSPNTCTHENCYWTLPIGDWDEDAIWEIMMQPMTVLEGTQRKQVKLRAEPSASSDAVGEVTCDSQGVHVIETLDNGWTLIEAYSSSAAKSKVKVYAEFVQGYVKTDLLQVKEAKTDYGILIDKLDQHLYIFKDGKVFSKMPICTGLVNARQPFNETPAGEFMIVSRTGAFWSGNMYCDMAMRINAGILIHEVPCLKNGSYRNYAPFEPVLGQKASHGCIRVPRTENAEGVNMKFLWDNIKINTKVLIWEDKGRDLPIPDGDTPMYYNPKGGQYYHDDKNCSSVRSTYLPLTAFTYGELDDAAYSELTICPYCQPFQRAREIEEYNASN